MALGAARAQPAAELGNLSDATTAAVGGRPQQRRGRTRVHHGADTVRALHRRQDHGAAAAVGGDCFSLPPYHLREPGPADEEIDMRQITALVAEGFDWYVDSYGPPWRLHLPE
jgi:hypothetical protein